MDSKSLVFVDAGSSLSQPPDPDPDPDPDSDSGKSSYEPSLRPLFDSIVDVLSRGASTEVEVSDRLVILDDVSTLEWIGFSFLDVCRFVRALVAACRCVSRQLFFFKKIPFMMYRRRVSSFFFFFFFFRRMLRS